MAAFVLAVFAAVYLGMALGRWPGLKLDRTGIAVIGALALYLSGAVDSEAVRRAVDIPTLAILFGLMILSAQFAACGFYDWAAFRLARGRTGPGLLLGLVVAASGLLSTILVNDVVVFAMAPLICAGLGTRGLDPRPFLIGLAGGANAGSVATVIGNPQNVLIGQVGGLEFWQFLAYCLPPAVFGCGAVWLVVWWLWRRRFFLGGAAREGAAPPALDRLGLYKAVLAVAALLALFATDLPREASVLGLAAILLVSRKLASRRMLALVDWPLLLLFASLFVVTGALTATAWPAFWLEGLKHSGFDPAEPPVMAAVALAGSNTIGNVPLVVLWLGLMPDLGPSGLYALAVFTTLSGNLLIVGSLANIIVVERAREQGVVLGFGEHARAGVPMTLLSLLFAFGWFALVG